MFWRKNRDAFVWQEYVRTTILVRRDQRRQHIEDIRDAAVDGIKHGARQGAALSVAGASAAGRSAIGLIVATYHGLTDLIAAIAAATALMLANTLAFAAPRISAAIVQLVETARVPALSVTLMAFGSIAALAASASWGAHGIDAATLKFAAISAVAFGVAAMPRLANLGAGTWLGRIRASVPRFATMPGAAAVLCYGVTGSRYCPPHVAGTSIDREPVRSASRERCATCRCRSDRPHRRQGSCTDGSPVAGCQ